MESHSKLDFGLASMKDTYSLYGNLRVMILMTMMAINGWKKKMRNMRNIFIKRTYQRKDLFHYRRKRKVRKLKRSHLSLIVEKFMICD